jgi:hypothetical protein
MIWMILIAFLVLILLWILLAPVIILLDSRRNLYRVFLPGILGVALVPGDTLFFLRIRVFFIPFRIDPFKKRKEKEGKKEAHKLKWSFSGGMKRALALLRTIRIRRFILDIDTDDFALNAQLVPVFSAINESAGNLDLGVNFKGQASLLLDARTRLGTVLWAYLMNR